MDERAFWDLIEETRADHPQRQEQRLERALQSRSRSEVLRFYELLYAAREALNSNELMAVDYLRSNCMSSDDGFMDFRDWLISLGRSVFDLARTQPDELVSFLDAHQDTGFSEMSLVVHRVLESKNDGRAHEGLGVCSTAIESPTGRPVAEVELPVRLPKTYTRFVTNATEQERMWRVQPGMMIERLGVVAESLREAPYEEDLATKSDEMDKDKS